VLGAAEIMVEVLAGEDAFVRIVGEDRHAGTIVETDHLLGFRYAGTSADAADLLARLIHGGVRVASFAPRKEGLEDLFLKVGAKELS
jgi:ABC-2 type transport system ATP-binding protein